MVKMAAMQPFSLFLHFSLLKAVSQWNKSCYSHVCACTHAKTRLTSPIKYATFKSLVVIAWPWCKLDQTPKEWDAFGHKRMYAIKYTNDTTCNVF